MDLIEEQISLCNKYNASFLTSSFEDKIGVSIGVLKGGVYPINGLRHPPIGNTAGWYIWVGEYSFSDDFFVPIHIKHLATTYPDIFKYLGLAPGWRFLVAQNNYEDVWEDKDLLNVD